MRSRHAALSGSQLKPPALPGDIYCSEVVGDGPDLHPLQTQQVVGGDRERQAKPLGHPEREQRWRAGEPDEAAPLPTQRGKLSIESAGRHRTRRLMSGINTSHPNRSASWSWSSGVYR